MAERTARDVARLARLAQEIERKRVLCTELQRYIDALEPADVAVRGQRDELAVLQDQLKQALDMLRAIEQVESARAAGARLSALEELLSDVRWDVAEQVLLEELRRKNEEQQRQITQYEQQIAIWRAEVEELSEQLDRALQARAPVLRERQFVIELRRMVEHAERVLSKRQFGVLMDAVARLEGEMRGRPSVAKSIEDKRAATEPYTSQADILLLRSPRINRRYEYTVLLRTPSEIGSHGINIQDSSTVIEHDLRRMKGLVKSVTDEINLGLRRRFGGGSGDGASAGQVPVTRDLIPVTSAVGDRPAAGDVNQLLRKMGDLMYDLFMPEEMQKYLNATPCSLTITTNDLELPWELMACKQFSNGFLCLDRPVARMPMGRAYPQREPALTRPAGKLRFLLIYADPSQNLPAAEREVDRIQTGLEEAWRGRIDVEVIKKEAANGDNLNDMLRSGVYDVIHYAGHAAFDEDDPDLSGLLLHDHEVFFAQKVRRLLEGRPLVFLNACETGRTANETAPQTVGRYLQRPAEGLASAFIYGGALGCIGALWPVYDDAAAQFALSFYNKVLEGYMIGEAMRQARLDSRTAFPNQATWAAFVLYGDPTFRLLD